jgi:hypothetical protein
MLASCIIKSNGAFSPGAKSVGIVYVNVVPTT